MDVRVDLEDIKVAEAPSLEDVEKMMREIEEKRRKRIEEAWSKLEWGDRILFFHTPSGLQFQGVLRYSEHHRYYSIVPIVVTRDTFERITNEKVATELERIMVKEEEVIPMKIVAKNIPGKIANLLSKGKVVVARALRGKYVHWYVGSLETLSSLLAIYDYKVFNSREEALEYTIKKRREFLLRILKNDTEESETSHRLYEFLKSLKPFTMQEIQAVLKTKYDSFSHIKFKWKPEPTLYIRSKPLLIPTNEGCPDYNLMPSITIKYEIMSEELTASGYHPHTSRYIGGSVCFGSAGKMVQAYTRLYAIPELVALLDVWMKSYFPPDAYRSFYNLKCPICGRRYSFEKMESHIAHIQEDDTEVSVKFRCCQKHLERVRELIESKNYVKLQLA